MRTGSRKPSCSEDILVFMADQGVHIIITYGTRGRHVEAPSTLLHASDYYMECMCTFLSSHRTIKAGNYFSTLPCLLLAASLTRDYIYPRKNCTVDQCATYPGIPMHINRIKECALLLFFSDVLEVTATTLIPYEENSAVVALNSGSQSQNRPAHITSKTEQGTI